MTDASYLTAAEIKTLLVETLTVQVRNARLDFDQAPHDTGDPDTGRFSTRDSIRESVRLLREMKAVPDNDPRIIRLAELVPAPELLLSSIPDDGMIPVSSASAFLDALVSYAVHAAGS